MSVKTRRLSGLTAVLLGLAAAYLTGVITAPKPIQATWIRLTAASDWDRNNRLGMLLELDMTSAQVEALMGTPSERTDLRQNSRWIYRDVNLCQGNDLILHLLFDRLCYIHQESEARVVGLSPRHYTRGTPLSWGS